jgi:hypothetical protein
VVVTCGRRRWGMGVGSPIPVVPVFGCPVVAVSELVDGLICALGGFLCPVLWFPELVCLVPEVELLGLVSLFVDHPPELFELTPFVIIVYELPELVYFVFLAFKLPGLVSCS